MIRRIGAELPIPAVTSTSICPYIPGSVLLVERSLWSMQGHHYMNTHVVGMIAHVVGMIEWLDGCLLCFGGKRRWAYRSHQGCLCPANSCIVSGM